MGEYITPETVQLTKSARRNGLEGRVLMAEGHYSTPPTYIFCPDSNAAVARSRKNRARILGDTFEEASAKLEKIAERNYVYHCRECGMPMGQSLLGYCLECVPQKPLEEACERMKHIVSGSNGTDPDGKFKNLERLRAIEVELERRKDDE